MSRDENYNAHGMFGAIQSATLKNISLNNVYVVSKEYNGGLVGYVYPNEGFSTIENCYTTGNVKGRSFLGGLVGHAGSRLIVKDCYSRCDISGELGNANPSNAGGLIGRITAGTIENAYSAGVVNSNDATAGGMIGDISTGTPTITDCFYDMGETKIGGTGKTTTEMKMESTYTNWDFTNVWLIDPLANDGYPYLNPAAPAPSVPVSDWAIYFGVLLIAAFMVVRYRRVNIA